MFRKLLMLLLLPFLPMLAACATGPSLDGANIPSGSAAYQALATPPAQPGQGEYRIAPFDALAISVFRYRISQLRRTRLCKSMGAAISTFPCWAPLPRPARPPISSHL